MQEMAITQKFYLGWKLLFNIFNVFSENCQIIWHVSQQIIWLFWRLNDDSLFSSTEDVLFLELSDSSLISVSSSQPQLLLISLSDRPLSFCWVLKGIQLQSIKSVAAMPKRTCPTRTPTTSTVVSDSCPIEGSYNFFSHLIFIIIRI